MARSAPDNGETLVAHVSADDVSLSEVHGTVAVPEGAGFWRKLLAFTGPGYLVAVGYMDPGNWATDIAGGARYGYALLSVVFFSNLLAVLLQALAARLGIASGRDLAQTCRDTFSRRTTVLLWILAEIAIAATDLAEVLGSAIALKLLFGLPVAVGVCVTSLDVLLVLYLQRHRFRYVEALVILLIASIAAAFAIELVFARPDFGAAARGLLPSSRLFLDPGMLYVAIGILGATVMPHNLYLHSSIVQTRKYGDSRESRSEAASFGVLDSTAALTSALFINAAILVVAAATFHGTPYERVADMSDAYRLLSPLLGSALAAPVFALALLFSSQNATLTGTLAGQIVMEGFIEIRIRPWLRRLVTRLVAIVPALVTVLICGERSSGSLLILSQVILSLQLPFAVIPLIVFVSDRKRMRDLAIGRGLKLVAWPCAILISALNLWLVWQVVAAWVR